MLRRASYSPNIKERADCSCALFTADGELLVQAENIPVHLGSMPASVAAVIDRFGGRLRPGDQVIVNDPFAGGTHLNDITLVAPCFVPEAGGPTDGGAWSGGWPTGPTTPTWAAPRPGSMPAEATEMFQEGLRLPPVLIDDGGAGHPAGQHPHARRSVAATSTRSSAPTGWAWPGWRRWPAAPLHEVVDYGERRMRAALRAVATGSWSFEDGLDCAGSLGRARQRASRWSGWSVTVAVAGDEITVDFTGSAPQTRRQRQRAWRR